MGFDIFAKIEGMTNTFHFQGQFQAAAGGYLECIRASQVALVVKNLPASAGDIRDAALIPGLGRYPGGGHGNTPWYSCLVFFLMDRGAWWATVHRVQRVGHD